MRACFAAIQVEHTKLYRSQVLWGTLLFFLFVTAIRVGEGDWAAYLQNMVFMYASVFGLIGFGALAGWTFGREYTDRTVKDLLALPVSRGRIVTAKLVSTALWSLIMTLLTFLFAVLLGAIVRIPGFSPEMLQHYFVQLLIVSCIQLLLCGPVVFVASVSRGYLAPIAYAFTTLMIALIAGPTRLGAFLPWSVAALQLAGSGTAVFPLSPVSYLIPAIAGIAGLAGTWAWWRWADQR
ncbi:MAG: bacitracin transporter permease [Paenibacillaceae bacterium]|jgi:ABC-2 type transport system permease protein|nr:bacitracin transporter permease [Paenibacillaceae bacterium]